MAYRGLCHLILASIAAQQSPFDVHVPKGRVRSQRWRHQTRHSPLADHSLWSACTYPQNCVTLEMGKQRGWGWRGNENEKMKKKN